jgi:uncharacterized protein YacL
VSKNGFVSVLLVLQIVVAEFILWPIKMIVKALRRLVLRWPLASVAMLLSAMIVLIVDKLALGQLQWQVFGPVLAIAVLFLLAVVSAMWPAKMPSEFEHVDHKSRSNQRDWVAST